MKHPSDFTRENLDPYLHKRVVITYKDEEKGTDAQILRGTLEELEMGENRLPIMLVIRNESGDRLKVSIIDVKNFREGE
jgi:hypothetical protein